HYLGICKPCAFVFKGGCSSGTVCGFCHLCPPEDKKLRKRLWKERRTRGRRSPAGRRGRRHGGLSRPLSLSGQGSQRKTRVLRNVGFPPNPRLTRPRLSCGAPAVKARRGAGVFKHLGILGASRVPTSPSRGEAARRKEEGGTCCSCPSCSRPAPGAALGLGPPPSTAPRGAEARTRRASRGAPPGSPQGRAARPARAEFEEDDDAAARGEDGEDVVVVVAVVAAAAAPAAAAAAAGTAAAA
ncbi:unnamed protein product, partial [Prorocentrum cordatum]